MNTGPGRVARRLGALALAAAPLAMHGQAPMVNKVEPPSWWTQSTINPVRLLVRGTNLGGARLTCGRLRCTNVKVNDRGTYLFADVAIPPGTRPGSYPLAVGTGRGTTSIPFEVVARLPTAGRYQGFGPEDVLYLLMPDRFANGDTGNDAPSQSPGLLDRSKGRYYHGGDLAGVRQKLPYLRNLGITAIWMNPIYDNNNALNRKETYDNQPITDYHGYGATDFYAVDEHLGDLNQLRGLVDEAHRHGIKIILDMVANHSGPYHPWVQDSPTPTWFHGTEASHPNNTWQTWTLADPYATDAMRRATLDGWFINILPDLNQDDPEVARYIIQNTLWWIGMSGLDGIRQDTWPYVPRRFWKLWMAAIKREFPSVKVVGEVFDGDPSMIAFFEGGRVKHDGIDDKVDALFDFPLFFTIRSAFAQGRSIRDVAQMVSRDHLYARPSSLVTFLGLHDVARFMNENGASHDGLKLAFTFLLTARGTPLIYYGDEIALPGGNDPDNRRDFPGGWPGDPRNAFETAGRSAAEADVWAHVQRLLRLRAARSDLRTAPMRHLTATETTFAYQRGSTVVVLNNAKQEMQVTLPALTLGADLLGACASPRTGAADGSMVTVPPRTGCVFAVQQ